MFKDSFKKRNYIHSYNQKAFICDKCIFVFGIFISVVITVALHILYFVLDRITSRHFEKNLFFFRKCLHVILTKNQYFKFFAQNNC